MDSRKAERKIMVLGGSTSDTWWTEPSWLAPFATALNRNCPTLLFNGSVCGYHSGQEFLKVARDVPLIRPHIILSLSGINEFVGHHVASHPLFSSFEKSVAEFLSENVTAFDGYNAGPPHSTGGADVFLRHGRFMRMIAEEHDACFLQLLQPTLGTSAYNPNEDEASMLTAAGDHYLQTLTEFYTGVRSAINQPGYEHLLDVSDAYAGQRGLFVDLRHVNQQGNDLLASHIALALQLMGLID
jgi:hypothetical protein